MDPTTDMNLFLFVIYTVVVWKLVALASQYNNTKKKSDNRTPTRKLISTKKKILLGLLYNIVNNAFHMLKS